VHVVLYNSQNIDEHAARNIEEVRPQLFERFYALTETVAVSVAERPVYFLVIITNNHEKIFFLLHC